MHAKNIFCHIMSNGWIAPCPYLPLVFGDATRESVVEVFERMQSHPLVRLGGDTCPMRNPDYIEEHIRPMGAGRPFYPIASENQVDLGAPCPPDCRGCDAAGRPPRRPAEAVIRDLQAVDPNYRSIEFYGGDALLRADLIGILGRVLPGMDISLWTTGRFVPEDPGFRERLRSFPFRAIRVMMPLDGAGTPGGFGDALDGSGPFKGWASPSICTRRRTPGGGAPYHGRKRGPTGGGADLSLPPGFGNAPAERGRLFRQGPRPGFTGLGPTLKTGSDQCPSAGGGGMARIHGTMPDYAASRGNFSLYFGDG